MQTPIPAAAWLYRDNGAENEVCTRKIFPVYSTTSRAGKAMTGTLGDLIPPDKRVLWVSSCGGHLAELKKMADLYPELDSRSMWVTFNTPQARSMLSGRNVQFIPSIGTRDAWGTLHTILAAYRILRSGSYHYVVSTGAAVAVSFLPLAAWMGVQALYVESLARTHAPSATGRLLRLFPGVQTYTQYERWANDRWKYSGSVLDNWDTRLRGRRTAVRNVFVSLGTIQPYRFDRAVDAVRAVLPDDCSVTWQLGATSRDDVPGTTHSELPWEQMGQLIRDSDAFVCHAGVGSVLQALDNGAVPLLAVRSARQGEHVDDHQEHFAREILRRGLGRILPLSGDAGGALQQIAQWEPLRQEELEAARELPPLPVLESQLRSFRYRGPGQAKRTAVPAAPHRGRSADPAAAVASTAGTVSERQLRAAGEADSPVPHHKAQADSHNVGLHG